MIKAGWKTSEFWVTIGGVATMLAQMAGALPQESRVQTVAVGVMTAVYTIARTVAKVLSPDPS